MPPQSVHEYSLSQIKKLDLTNTVFVDVRESNEIKSDPFNPWLKRYEIDCPILDRNQYDKKYNNVTAQDLKVIAVCRSGRRSKSWAEDEIVYGSPAKLISLKGGMLGLVD